MDLFSHQGIFLILFGRSAIQSVCLFEVHRFVPFHLMALKALLRKCFSDLNLYEAVSSSDLVVQLKLKPTHYGIIEAKEVYIQLSFERC